MDSILRLLFSLNAFIGFKAPSSQTVMSSLDCSARSLSQPILPNVKILSLSANLVSNYSQNVHIGLFSNHGAVNVVNTTFCNVSITYTHPTLNDTINVRVYLPQHESWNGRMQAVGGAGWQAGLTYPALSGMAAAASQGYASLSTNAGLGSAVSPLEWPHGSLEMNLENLATTSLNDAALIGKSVVKNYYGISPAYSYWTGCSQGGRQGFELAQRYPEAFDGIAASAPALYAPELFVADFLPMVLMNELGIYPRICEFEAITAAAISACDSLDGVRDNIISRPDLCNFDAKSVVGNTFTCEEIGENLTISDGASRIANQIWSDYKLTDGNSLWYGLSKDVVLATSNSITGGALATTTCFDNGTCVPAPLRMLTPWLELFVYKNASIDFNTFNRTDFERAFERSKQQYNDLFKTSVPELSAFKSRGGKIISYHGLADQIISPGFSKRYYDAITTKERQAQDFFRLFFAPGLGHCIGGYGAYPDGTFDTLVRWVEEGLEPEYLNATSVDGFGVPAIQRRLCPYPKVQVWNGKGDVTAGEGFECVDSEKIRMNDEL